MIAADTFVRVKNCFHGEAARERTINLLDRGRATARAAKEGVERHGHNLPRIVELFRNRWFKYLATVSLGLSDKGRKLRQEKPDSHLLARWLANL